MRFRACAFLIKVPQVCRLIGKCAHGTCLPLAQRHSPAADVSGRPR